MTVVIKAEGLTKYYGPVVGVKDLDLEVEEGEIFGFLGPNGAGKTTTIRLLAGFLRPTRGRATVFGLDTWKESVKIKGDLGFLPDFPSLYDDLTGEEFLDYLIRLQGGGTPLLRQELCQRLELSQQALRRRIRGYSHGMRQKLAIVQALQHDPSLLILDEPSEGLDPLMQQSLYRILLELNARGRTIFMSSHILPEAERLCQRVGMIKDGTLVTVDEVEELKARKVRRMEVTLAGDTPSPDFSLPCVLSMERNVNSFRLTVQGDINPLLRELARHEVAELVYAEASLEDIFLEFYR